MAIKSLAQTLKDLATGIKNTVTGVTGSNATLTITKGNGTTSTVTVNNVATATNADKLDGYHYTDIINNAKASVSSGVMGAPNWDGRITYNNSDVTITAPNKGFVIAYKYYSKLQHLNVKVNNIPLVDGGNQYDGAGVTVPVKQGDVVHVIDGAFIYFVPCS